MRKTIRRLERTAGLMGLAAVLLTSAPCDNELLSLTATQPASQTTTQRDNEKVPSSQKPRSCKLYNQEDIKKYAGVRPTFALVRTSENDPLAPDEPIYAELTVSFDPTNPSQKDIYAILDVRNVWIKHRDGTEEKADKYHCPITGDEMKALARGGENVEMKLYVLPESLDIMTKHPFLKDKVDMIFKSPFLQRYSPPLGSREYNILKTGNPEHLLSKEPKKHIFIPPSFSEEKFK
jgi:hypothetical protein